MVFRKKGVYRDYPKKILVSQEGFFFMKLTLNDEKSVLCTLCFVFTTWQVRTSFLRSGMNELEPTTRTLLQPTST